MYVFSTIIAVKCFMNKKQKFFTGNDIFIENRKRDKVKSKRIAFTQF